MKARWGCEKPLLRGLSGGVDCFLGVKALLGLVGRGGKVLGGAYTLAFWRGTGVSYLAN